MTTDPPATDALARWLGEQLGDPTLEVAAASRLKGGAIQQNWLVETTGRAGRMAFVLRRDAPAAVGESHSRATEYAIVEAAWRAGVRVPQPVAFCHDPGVFGGPFALMAKVDGVGFGPRVARDMALGGDRAALVRELGRQLAKLHRVVPGDAGLACLGPPPQRPVDAEIERMRNALDALGQARPALEWGLRWAEVHQPRPERIVLLHRDFRTGNYMVDGAGLTAILDWEFAGWGEPHADLGWFCAECWRFGRTELEAGGIGHRADFYAGYEDESGRKVDDLHVRFWEVVAHIRWAVIALQQGERHASGREPSLELALTGLIAPELELALLRATAPALWKARHAG